MKRAQNSDSKTHVKKSNPTSRTEIKRNSLYYLFLETPCISMILVPWPWCMYDTWMYDAHIHDLCPWCMYDAQMYDAHIRDPCPWSWCMHDACILVLECMMHTPAAAPPIENRIKKRYEHTFNGRSSSRSEQGYYGVGIYDFLYIKKVTFPISGNFKPRG